MVTAKPGEHPPPALLCDEDDFLDYAVSVDTDIMCYTAMAHRVEPGIAVIYGSEAAMLGGTGTRRINGRIYAGTIYIVGCKDGKLVSLSDADLVRYTLLLWKTEQYTEEEVRNSYIFEW